MRGAGPAGPRADGRTSSSLRPRFWELVEGLKNASMLPRLGLRLGSGDRSSSTAIALSSSACGAAAARSSAAGAQ